MAYEIIGETIKSATSIKLGQIFDNPKRYKENITKQSYPNFHIIQVQLTQEPAGLTNRNRITNVDVQRMRLDYLVNIQYRVAENTETITNLQQQLDEVGLKLCTELTELDLELPTKTYNRNYEKVDGILQFFFNITVYAVPELEDEQKMNDLSLGENLIIEEE